MSGQLVDWGVMYEKILKDLHDGTWKPDDLWWLIAEKAVVLGGSFDAPINPKFVDALKAVKLTTQDFGSISAHDLVFKRYEQMKKGTDLFDPYSGPITDNTGKLQIKAGEKASKADLLRIMYYVDKCGGNDSAITTDERRFKLEGGGLEKRIQPSFHIFFWNR